MLGPTAWGDVPHSIVKDFVEVGPCTDETPCGDCVEIMHERLECLAANIAIGAMGAMSFKLGTEWPYYLNADDMTDDFTWAREGTPWRPNTSGRPAPGWNKEEK